MIITPFVLVELPFPPLFLFSPKASPSPPTFGNLQKEHTFFPPGSSAVSSPFSIYVDKTPCGRQKDCLSPRPRAHPPFFFIKRLCRRSLFLSVFLTVLWTNRMKRFLQGRILTPPASLHRLFFSGEHPGSEQTLLSYKGVPKRGPLALFAGVLFSSLFFFHFLSLLSNTLFPPAQLIFDPFSAMTKEA